MTANNRRVIDKIRLLAKLKNVIISEENFKRVVGVKKATFKVMVEEYKKAEEERKEWHKIGGRKPKLCEEDRVLFMLEYYRKHRTPYHMGIDYGISEGEASKVVRDVESVLIKSGNFSLPSKRVLYEADKQLNTETTKKQRTDYSGKKKQHTLKAQIVVDQNYKILCVNTTNGKEHDFSLYKRSKLRILEEIKSKVDLGYVGIKKFHSNVEIPKKRR